MQSLTRGRTEDAADREEQKDFMNGIFLYLLDHPGQPTQDQNRMNENPTTGRFCISFYVLKITMFELTNQRSDPGFFTLENNRLKYL